MTTGALGKRPKSKVKEKKGTFLVKVKLKLGKE